MSVDHQSQTIQQQTSTRTTTQEVGSADPALDGELSQVATPLHIESAPFQQLPRSQKHTAIQRMQRLHGNRYMQRQLQRQPDSRWDRLRDAVIGNPFRGRPPQPQIQPPRSTNSPQSPRSRTRQPDSAGQPQANIDWSFISEKEGGQRLTGYVPDPRKSQSGVTIATGFDLGARNEADLRRLRLPQSLVSKLSPYLGLKRWRALSELQGRPLTITQREADLIDRASKGSALSRLTTAYNRASSTPFESLPREAQTVIASVAFQYGDLPAEAPTFWGHVIRQDWAAAINELENFGDGYPTRRRAEAVLLRRMTGTQRR